MKLIGRILLLIAAGLLLGVGIPSFVKAITDLNSVGWWPIFDEVRRPLFVTLLIEGLGIFVSLSAIFCAIKGKASFFLTIVAIVLIGLLIWYFIEANNAGLLSDWKNVLQVVFGVISPLCLIGGSILIRL